MPAAPRVQGLQEFLSVLLPRALLKSRAKRSSPTEAAGLESPTPERDTSMREHAKPTKGSSKRFRSLLIISIVLVAAALAAGAAAVVSRQSAKAQAPTEREGRSAVANETGETGKQLVTTAT